MLGVKVKKENAEGLRRFLSESGRLDMDRAIFSRGSFVYFPLTEKPDAIMMIGLRKLGATASDVNFMQQKRKKSYLELLGGKLSAWDVARGYDLLGDIAVIDARPRPASRMARALMRSNRSIKTVLRKGGAIRGRFRTRKFYYVAGRRNYLASYRENGCTFRFDVRDVFFSPRLAHERSRVSGLARNGESVMVMFSGVGPFAIEIAKAHRRCSVVGIELNRKAHNYAVENARLNKTANAAFVHGDVKRVAKLYERSADRIVMPLPKGASKFLSEVITVAKARCTVHYYTFCKSGEEARVVEGLRKFFESHGKGFRLVSVRVVRPYSSTEVEIAIDFVFSDKKL